MPLEYTLEDTKKLVPVCYGSCDASMLSGDSLKHVDDQGCLEVPVILRHQLTVIDADKYVRVPTWRTMPN